MNKNTLLDKSEANMTVEVHGLSHDGRGIATIQQKTTFIEGCLPKELVTYQITQKRSHYQEAKVLKILSTASDRAEPPCQHYGVCGGCSLQHMNLDTQLQLKQQTVLDQLKHFGKVTPEVVLPPLVADTLGYRRKARLGVKYVIKKEKLLVGFREKSSNYLADLERCVVLHPAVGERFAELSRLIRSLDGFRNIPQIEVAIGDTQVALVFRHMAPLSDNDLASLIAFGKQHDIHIYLQPNPPAPVSQCWPSDGDGRVSYTLPDEALTFRFHPLDFTQVNLNINRAMISQAMNLLELNANETVLDLFCGIGNFTLPMAKRAKHVTGIEGGSAMVERAYENAAYNNIQNVDYYAANLETPPTTAPWVKQTYDKILLDPPRVGAKDVIALIPNFNAKRIVYVSCNPATLARDAGELVHTHKYRLKKVGIMNMFPHTSHIEAMAVFDKE